MIPEISGLPLRSLIICFPRNKPIKEILNVNNKIIDTWSHTVTPSDKPVCIVTPAARASIAVKTP